MGIPWQLSFCNIIGQSMTRPFFSYMVWFRDRTEKTNLAPACKRNDMTAAKKQLDLDLHIPCFLYDFWKVNVCHLYIFGLSLDCRLFCATESHAPQNPENYITYYIPITLPYLFQIFPSLDLDPHSAMVRRQAGHRPARSMPAALAPPAETGWNRGAFAPWMMITLVGFNMIYPLIN